VFGSIDKALHMVNGSDPSLAVIHPGGSHHLPSDQQVHLTDCFTLLTK